MRRVALGATALAFAAIAIACKDEKVVLATIPGGDGGPSSIQVRCTGPSDCPAGSFCDKHDCRDTAGVCEPFPAVCNDEEEPVCGCDGLTYFNECLRRAAGVVPDHGGECGPDAVTCNGATACPSGASCAQLLGIGPPGAPPPPCAPDVRGTCWVLPATCPPPTRTDRWNACGGGPSCVDTCNAIRSETPHVRAASCQ